MALSSDRKTPRRSGDTRVFGVAAGAAIHAGALTCINSSGYAVPGSVSTALKAVGRACESEDNASGANGVRSVRVETGIFRFNNSAAADEITAADISADCFVVDDETVAKTNGSSTRSVAGKVFDVDDQGVWVQF